eukprot:4801441-Amphidinium_carterae.1
MATVMREGEGKERRSGGSGAPPPCTRIVKKNAAVIFEVQFWRAMSDQHRSLTMSWGQVLASLAGS